MHPAFFLETPDNNSRSGFCSISSLKLPAGSTIPAHCLLNSGVAHCLVFRIGLPLRRSRSFVSRRSACSLAILLSPLRIWFVAISTQSVGRKSERLRKAALFKVQPCTEFWLGAAGVYPGG